MKNGFILLLIFFTSCGPSRVFRPYTNGGYGNIKSYVSKPEYLTENTSATYITGEVGLGELQYRTSGDKKTAASLQFHRAHTGKHYNFHYGAGGTYGSYKFNTSLLDAAPAGQRKEFYGLNVKTGINYLKSIPKVDFRILGVELNYRREFGPYQDLLQEVDSDNFTESDYLQWGYEPVIVPNQSLFSIDLNTEIIFKIKEEKTWGIGFYGGKMFYDDTDADTLGDFFGGGFLSYRYRRFIFSFIREFTNGEDLKVNSGKFGLTYRL